MCGKRLGCYLYSGIRGCLQVESPCFMCFLLRLFQCVSLIGFPSQLFGKAAEGKDPLPVPYRHSLTPARSGKCNTFVPNALKGSESPKCFDCIFETCSVSCIDYSKIAKPRHRSWL